MRAGERSLDGRRWSPPFAYTDGLTALGKPKLLIHGQQACYCYELLHQVGSRIRDGRAVAAGDVVERDLPVGLPITAVSLIDTRDLIYARQLYGDLSGSLQLVWPDQRCRMFWERSHSLTRRVQQIRGVTPNAQQLQGSYR